MKDTTDEMLNKQREIIFSKTLAERFMMGIEMCEDVRKIVKSSIKNKNPGISKLDLKIEVFKRYYTNDFSQKELDLIIESMRRYYFKKLTKQ